MSSGSGRGYAFEGFRLDPQTRQVFGADGTPLPLTLKAFDVLAYLIAHRDRIVGKDELLAEVWAGRVVEENNLTQAISALRRAFGTGAGDHRYILTVPGRGYRFIAPVQEDEATAALPLEVAAITGSVVAPVRRRVLAMGALLFMLALLAVAAWRLRDAPAPAQVPAQVPARAPPGALAVLPFRSIAPEPRDELLELGLADTLITRLSRSQALRVRSLASAQRLSEAHMDPLAAGRELGAAYVVEGSIQRAGEQVRINSRLLSVADGATVWAGTFDAPVDRAFLLQDRVAASVASALALQHLDEPARSACDGADAIAFRAYLRGQYWLNRPTPAHLTAALAEFQRAIDRDPTCSRAYAGMALAYRGLVYVDRDRDPRELFPLAKAAVAQALRIDPDSADALVAQAHIQELYDWNWTGAETSLQRAIALNPSLAEAHYAYAHLLVSLGRFDEGLAQARQARELDPLSPRINALEAGFLSAANRPDEARAAVERALRLRPDFWLGLLVRGGIRLDAGDTAGAIADLDRAAMLSGRHSHVLSVLAVAHVAAGNRPHAQAILKELEARGATGYVASSSLAVVRSALGDSEAALDLLERAHQEHDIRMPFLGVDASWNSLRGEPRFRALARRLGLESERGYARL